MQEYLRVNSNYLDMKAKLLILYFLLIAAAAKSLQSCATPQTAAHQAPPYLVFSRQPTGVGCHCLLLLLIDSDPIPLFFNLFILTGG